MSSVIIWLHANLSFVSNQISAGPSKKFMHRSPLVVCSVCWKPFQWEGVHMYLSRLRKGRWTRRCPMLLFTLKKGRWTRRCSHVLYTLRKGWLTRRCSKDDGRRGVLMFVHIEERTIDEEVFPWFCSHWEKDDGRRGFSYVLFTLR